MKKYFIYVISILAILYILLMLLIRYYPVKRAVNEHSAVQTEREYIICNAAYTTGFEWVVEQSSNAYNGYIFIEGAMENAQVSIQHDVLPYNKFILYGKFDGKRDFDGATYPVFLAENWEIIAPVKREIGLPAFFSPSYGLTWMDFHHSIR